MSELSYQLMMLDKDVEKLKLENKALSEQTKNLQASTLEKEKTTNQVIRVALLNPKRNIQNA